MDPDSIAHLLPELQRIAQICSGQPLVPRKMQRLFNLSPDDRRLVAPHIDNHFPYDEEAAAAAAGLGEIFTTTSPDNALPLNAMQIAFIRQTLERTRLYEITSGGSGADSAEFGQLDDQLRAALPHVPRLFLWSPENSSPAGVNEIPTTPEFWSCAQQFRGWLRRASCPAAHCNFSTGDAQQSNGSAWWGACDAHLHIVHGYRVGSDVDVVSPDPELLKWLEFAGDLGVPTEYLLDLERTADVVSWGGN